MLTRAQIQNARKLLGWSPADLARMAKVSRKMIDDTERLDGMVQAKRERQAAIQHAFAAAGIEFVTDGTSVRLKRPS